MSRASSSHHGASLYRRLLIWLLLPLVITLAMLLLQAWQSAQRSADRAYDRLLASAAGVMAESVSWQDDRLWFDISTTALEMLAPRGDERVFYTLADANGAMITGNADLTTLLPPSQMSTDFATVTAYWHGIELRVGARHSRLTGWRNRAPFTVLVAHTPEARHDMAWGLFRDSALRLVGVLLLAAGALLLAVGMALRPLQRLRRHLRSRRADDLRPLQMKAPRELGELIDALNLLLARQRRAQMHQQRFIGDASHQLRTPLAGISASAELALRSDDSVRWREALIQLQGGTRRAARLAEQLLSLTRLNSPEAPLERRPLALEEIAREALLRFLDAADRRGIDLGLAEPCPARQLPACDWQLEEALGNLIDNALRHAASRVTVGVRQSPPALWVADDGPGVPVELHSDMLRPFRRREEGSGGSGLGLAIVDSIARAHGGRVAMTAADGDFTIYLELGEHGEPDTSSDAGSEEHHL
ncbi:HAMP domain-containing histidine kinase [Kushneria aurantia]|uniref:histidine kinase n=1 Tax=Kushneria aurantia TaxID=504092 RepID=A0ABV6G852_9GAMM|nr:HAMP domain-containing histidine kinase [Kushneria aurantia]